MQYRNDSDRVISVVDIDGFNRSVYPGKYVESYIFYDEEGLTRIDDSGLYNPIAANVIFTVGVDPSDHVLHTDTKLINITRISDSITVRPQVDEAVPFLLEANSADPIVDIDRPKKWFDRLRISGTGTCNIIEFRYNV